MQGQVEALAAQRRSVVSGDGIRLSVIEQGLGQPLVILPAWTNGAIEYWHQIVEFGQDFRVLAVDMRGHGESEKTEHGYRVGRFAADLHDVLSTLDARDAVLMGHSMGCAVIWAYLDVFGAERVAKLILVDQAATQLIQPWWSADERRDYGATTTAAELFELCVRLTGPDGETFTSEMFKSLFTPAFPAAEAEAVVREILKMPRRHAAALMLDHATRDWRDVIGRICLPTMVVGARRSVFPAESQAWIAARIPGARLEIFEAEQGGSHFMCMENPTLFNRLVRAFLRG